jgi:predicted DNA-binding transcriptional regulator AlpA
VVSEARFLDGPSATFWISPVDTRIEAYSQATRQRNAQRNGGVQRMNTTSTDTNGSERNTIADGGPAPLLLRADQAAALCNTSARTWRTWDAAGKIPRAIRIGRSTYWRPEELKAWVAAGCPDRRVWRIMQEE